MLRIVLTILMLVISWTLAAQDTQLKLYRPFGDMANQVSPTIVSQMEGECGQQSKRIKREDAWRCNAAGKIFDPCFVKEYGSYQEVICPQSPWLAKSVLLHLTSKLDNALHVKLDLSQTYPWALELVTGEHCQAIDEDLLVDQIPVRYRCDSQAILIGSLQRCKTQWSILQRQNQGQNVMATINKAWF